MLGAALITIDLQNDFILEGPAKIGGTAECLPQVAKLVRLFRIAEAPIVHAIRLYDADGTNAEPFRRPFISKNGPVVAPDSRGSELPAELEIAAQPHSKRLYRKQQQKVGPAEWIMYKPRWDAFFDTALADILRLENVTTVVVCGCNLPNCPRATLFGASNRDFRTILVRDATSQVTEERLFDLGLIGTTVCMANEVEGLLSKNF